MPSLLKQKLQKLARDLDPILVGSALALTAIGVLLIYSAQHDMPDPKDRILWSRQLMWWVVAMVCFVLSAWLPLRMHEVFAYVYLGAVALLLMALLWLGVGTSGQWISLGPAYLQPSEPAKLALLFALSRYLAYLNRPIIGWKPLFQLGLLVAPIWFLVIKQPDLGTSLVFWALTLVLVFWAGAPPLSLFLLISPLISLVLAFNWIAWIIYLAVLLAALFISRPRLIMSVGVVAANVLFGIVTPLAWNKFMPYQKMRILVFLDPGSDPRGSGYQIIQSKVAIGSGGFWGKGFLHGTQTALNFLPEKHTDFIYSVGGEELGFWGGMLILILFGLFLWRAIDTGYLARNRFARFLVVGGAGITAFQLLVNVGMTLGLMPVTGLPLPFVSYGGSSLCLFWVLTGLTVNVRRRWQDY
ncbi:MAG: rod shape-determining protein RodA [candidate division Zixibacteria bacterium]|nr:rod shape-determining protein RodA [candidate division Zixibacteria bacterium]